MIEVTGAEGTAEFRTAQKIARAFEAYWPGIASTPASEDHVKIAANRKLSNYKVSDIDIVIAARLGGSRYIVPKAALRDHDGKRVSGTKIRVRSFVAAVEVKDQDAAGLDIGAANVDAKYREGWKSATAQNDAQKYALLNYFRDVTGKEPWIYRCLALEGIYELPKDRGRVMPEAATVASNFDASSLLVAMIAENTVGKIGKEYAISSGEPDLIEQVLACGIFKSVTPSALDRRKMDRIAARPEEARQLAVLLGEERVHLRGEGGTGKTVLLAQAAHEAFKAQGKRSLILTYNHALAADIQRLLALMNVPSSSDNGGVDVRTVMSFSYAWLSRLGCIKGDEDLEFQQYETRCQEALKFFDEGALSDEDIQSAKRADPEQLDYDAILVDEAQDWPQSEADLVSRLYGGERIAIADGMSQLVRGRATNWKASVQGRSLEGHRSLDECLRMKANLGTFANAVAERAGLNWHVIPSTMAAGGRVIIRTSPLEELLDVHDTLSERARSAGNEPVDFLYCVPPSSVRKSGNRMVSALGDSFRSRGLGVWDGTDNLIRRDFPRATRDHRIIQYESCRGLEGWFVVLDRLDEFWELKHQEFMALGPPEGQLDDPARWGRSRAWNWTMIPLTRPIDTLFITLRDMESTASKLLLSVAETMPDFVDVG
ncbi:AAA family ATPase [Roseovarius aestuariivivens]|uniref:AAA family ATPase n=1 Tax=Roseovarius aestuariivivens TaxID=1888910 RepID=UPI0010812DBB|nr:AAA family ATPase [Roseovarius aestuariivivens]